MDPRFEQVFSHPSNDIFNVVFFPDRVYHAQYLNATRSTRYRYNVTEVRGKADVQVLKGEVYLDNIKFTNFLRVEYWGRRLVEQSRERARLLTSGAIAWMRVLPKNANPVETRLRLEHCRWTDAFQVEIWGTLEPPQGQRHDYKVLAMMGHKGSITRVPQLSPLLDDLRALRQVELAFREEESTYPSGYTISDSEAGWDNFYYRNIQVPNSNEPSDDANTVMTQNYLVDFQRAFFVQDVGAIPPVRYLNAMMDSDHPHRNDNNVIAMRWVLQRELGGTLVFFHEVTIPAGKVEGTHQHIGSEELYYITEGEGVAYVGANDDPGLESFPIVEQHVFGLNVKGCREVPVKQGSVIFTKSGGIHGIRNTTSNQQLKFVAFLYHSN